jgi:hypothetical protein
MKYYLFAGEIYYARGGGLDFIKSSESLEELKICADNLLKTLENGKWKCYDWFHICDETMNIIHRSAQQAHSY